MGNTVGRALRLAIAALFVASVVGAATVEPDDPGGVFVTAAEATAKAGSAAYAIEVTVRVAATTTARGGGTFDFESEDGVLTMATPPVEAVIHDGVAYTRSPGQPKWLAVETPTFSPGPMPGFSQSDPLTALDGLREAGVARNIREEGNEEVRGVPTDRYSADLDPARLVPEEHRATVRAMGLKDVKYTVWIDEERRVRRLRTAFDSPQVSMEMTMELFDFGIPVTVAPPPADQVQRAPTR